MRLVLALGSRAVAGPGDFPHDDAGVRRQVRAAVVAIADVVRANEVVLVHPGASRGLDDALLELELRHVLPDRVIASPVTRLARGADGRPPAKAQEVVELGAVRTLVEAGAMVVCAARLAVVDGSDPSPSSVEPAIDDDLTAALIAEGVGADLLVLLTDVEAVILGYGHPGATPIGAITTSALHWSRFPVGSMGPKVQAACRFADATGGRAAIGSPADAVRLVAGTAGTQVTRAPTPSPTHGPARPLALSTVTEDPR